MGSRRWKKLKSPLLASAPSGRAWRRLLLDHGDRTARHAGRTLWLEKTVVRDLKKSARLRPAEGRADRQGR